MLGEQDQPDAATGVSFPGLNAIGGVGTAPTNDTVLSNGVTASSLSLLDAEGQAKALLAQLQARKSEVRTFCHPSSPLHLGLGFDAAAHASTRAQCGGQIVYVPFTSLDIQTLVGNRWVPHLQLGSLLLFKQLS
jgi:hypothetical protein